MELDNYKHVEEWRMFSSYFPAMRPPIITAIIYKYCSYWVHQVVFIVAESSGSCGTVLGFWTWSCCVCVLQAVPKDPQHLALVNWQYGLHAKALWHQWFQVHFVPLNTDFTLTVLILTPVIWVFLEFEILDFAPTDPYSLLNFSMLATTSLWLSVYS